MKINAIDISIVKSIKNALLAMLSAIILNTLKQLSMFYNE